MGTQEKDHYQDVVDACRKLGRIKVAVVHPVQANVIEAVMEAVDEGLIAPVLVGSEERIAAACKEAGVESKRFSVINTEHSHEAAAKAVSLAVSGEIDAIMKGSLHTDELLRAIISSASGLRTERRISHAYIMNVPTYHKPFFITDAAINIAPTLEEKADICRNAIDLWHVLFGADKKPKVAFALAYYALKAAQHIASMSVSIGGLDALIFTGGIGENAADVRDAILSHLSFLPAFEHYIIPANEERSMAMEILESFTTT